jgi:hypothetical protein
LQKRQFWQGKNLSSLSTIFVTAAPGAAAATPASALSRSFSEFPPRRGLPANASTLCSNLSPLRIGVIG